jgi:hypothetical protein
LEKMLILRHLTGFASAMLVVLVQLMLAGGGALACEDHPVRLPTETVETAGATSADGMAGMAGMPAHDGDQPSQDAGCPDSGMPSDECQAMSACTSIVAIAEQVAWAPAVAKPSGAVPVTQFVALLLSLPPESPPPRA